MAVYQEKAEAVKKIIESVRSLETLKITLPLGNPSLRFVHTNQFLFTQLPEDFFKLANMDEISKALDGTYSRNSGYQVNRWYVENLTIINDKSKFEMELEVNPFASTLNKYGDDKRSFEKTYREAESQKQKEEDKSKTNKVKSTAKKKISISKAVEEVAKKWKHIGYSHCCQSASATKKNGKGDCWGMSFLLACELKKKGVTVRILNYPTSMSSNHRSVQYKNSKGEWKNFPYRKYGFHNWFVDTSGVWKGRVIPLNCG